MRLIKIVVASALVVTTMPFAAGAARPAPAPGAGRTDHAAQRARLVRGLPLDPALAAVGTRAHAPDDSWDEAYLLSAGDLDGDGTGDLVDVRYHIVVDDTSGWTETVTLEARKGADGALLWKATPPAAAYVLPLFTRVGVDAKPGVVLVSYGGVGGDGGVVYGEQFDLTVTGYAGANGTPLWLSKSAGAGAGSLVAGGYAGGTTVVGEFDAVTGAATDLLLTTMSEGELPSGYTGSLVQAGVLDGATGTYRLAGAPVLYEDWDWFYRPGEDYDADGLDDMLAVSHKAGEPVLSALSSVDGTAIWTNDTIPEGWDWWELLPTGDATGDGVPDVAVKVIEGGGVIVVPAPGKATAAAPEMPDGGSSIVLVNGATGKTAWKKAGDRVAVLGDADRKKGVELLVGDYVHGKRSGFTAAAYTGSGRRVWSVTRLLPGSAELTEASFSVPGDVGGDGVADLGYGVWTWSRTGKITKRDEGVVDGRTGKVRRDPVKDMYALRVAVDGRGTDAYTRTFSGGLLTMTTYAGDTGRKLWTVSVAAPGFLRHTSGVLADRDRCADLVVAMSDGRTFSDHVLSGATGKPLWALKRTGVAAASVSKPAPKKHKLYRKTC